MVKAAGGLQAWPAQMAINKNWCPVSLHAWLIQMAASDQSSHTQQYPAGGAQERIPKCRSPYYSTHHVLDKDPQIAFVKLAASEGVN